MFSGFWGWFLVVLIVAAIFGAGKLPDLRKEAEEKLKLGMAALEKGKEELNKKIAEKTKKDNAAKKTVADENQTGGEEKTDGEGSAVFLCLFNGKSEICGFYKIIMLQSDI